MLIINFSSNFFLFLSIVHLMKSRIMETAQRFYIILIGLIVFAIINPSLTFICLMYYKYQYVHSINYYLHVYRQVRLCAAYKGSV